MDRYPLVIYRRGSSLEWEGHNLDALTVHSDDEYTKAMDSGWVEIAEILHNRLDADGDGKMGGSVDALDQKPDEELRAMVAGKGIALHHRAGRAKMLQILRGDGDE